MAALQQSNVTVVSNHVAAIDILVFAHIFRGRITGVAKWWLEKMPVASTFGAMHRVLYVGAEKSKVTPEAGTEDVKSATDTIAEYQQSCAADPQLFRCVIFPEGTTKSSHCLLKFRSGAFVAKEPVQPVAVRWPSDAGWCNSLSGHFFHLLTRWFMCLEVIILPPYVPSTEERADPKLYAQNVQNALAKALELPLERSSTAIGPTELIKLSKGEKLLPGTNAAE
jgi:lysophosphatidylcholine acyltransferase/lyso-PAF acetyltransferase